MALPTKIRMVEVGPRDGLQNEQSHLDVSDRLGLIRELSGTGLTVIEAGSFVSPKWVPQMAGTDRVLSNLDLEGDIAYPVLVPNRQGFDAAVEAGAKEIAVFAAASESFSNKNINCSIEESLNRFRPVVLAALARNIKVRGYVSCVLGCPYEGHVDPEIVAEVASRLFVMGAYEISLGDTIGVGTPGQAQQVIDAVSARVPVTHLAAHFHDTYGQALANLLAVMEKGVATIDSSVAGLGGCPYARGASGNVASEDVLYMLEGLGIETGVDLDALIQVGAGISSRLGRPNMSRVGLARTLGGGPVE
ncbi:MAG: hydroxymethylglutaryl-CoA lyase [Magnetovibrionaceae bacterium]